MILVTGATGTVGRAVVGLLSEAGAAVAAVTRTPGDAAPPPNVRVVRADPSRPDTLEDAMPGVGSVLVSPRAVGRGLTGLLDLAARHGVERVVLLSAITVAHPAGRPEFARDFAAAEEAVAASGLPHTFLRCADFAANALAWAPQVRSTGVVRGAYAGAATSPVHERDIAAVAVRALTGPGHEGRAYALTGPESLDQPDKAALIGAAIGRRVRFEELPPERVRAMMLDQGLAPEVPERLLGSLADYAENPGPTTDTVRQVLGRPALTFGEWAGHHAAAFR